MKIFKLNILTALIILFIAIGYISCKNDNHSENDDHDHNSGDTSKVLSDEHDHDHNHNHNEDDHNHEEDEHMHEKIVHLNESQYNSAGIELGWFEEKNLSDVINANGYTKLPPQNQANVSSVIEGIIKKIYAQTGQYVRAGQKLALLESPEIVKIQEAFISSEYNLKLLEQEYERQKTLSDENINAKKIFEKTASELEIEKVRYKSLKEQLAMIRLENTEDMDSKILITAPISGHITNVDINLGSYVTLGKSLFTIVDNSKLHVDLLVYEKDLFKVKPNQNVRFILTNQSDAEINGRIFSIGKSFENETKSVAVHAEIINNKSRLIPGMYVNAVINIGDSTVKALPDEAIINADGREFIFVWEKENTEEDHAESEITFARVEVKTGISQLGYKQVSLLQEIHEGDKIVVKGAYYLQSHLIKEQSGGHEH